MPKLGTGQGEAKAEPGGRSRLPGAGQGGRAARGEPWGKGDPEIYVAPDRGTPTAQRDPLREGCGVPDRSLIRSPEPACSCPGDQPLACWLGGLGLLLPGALSG